MLFHRHLDGEGPQPFEHFIGRLCEEFPDHLPSEVWAEVRRCPVGFLEQLIEYRAYARTKAIYDAADTPEAMKRLPRSELMDLVKRNEFALAKETKAP